MRAALGLLPLVVLALWLALPVSIGRAAPNTAVCGPITSDSTWTPAGNPYIITCTVQVMSGVRLTIQPSVTVVFSPTTSLQVGGTLIAQGATFTSGKATPAKGDWGHIFFTVTSVDAVFDSNGAYVSGSIIQDSLIEWGGGGGASVNGAIETSAASPFISQNTIRNNGDRGIYAVARSSGQPVVMRNNSVSGNTGGGIYASIGDIISNTIQGNSTSGNGGGISAVSSTIVSNTITNNFTSADGGGIYASDSILTGNTVSGNGSTFFGRGGGIYASGGTMTGNTVNGNSASRHLGYSANSYAYGGGIYANGGTLTGNTIIGNNVSASAFSYPGFTYGGGVYASLSTLTGNTVDANVLNSTYTYGGGIFSDGSLVTGNTIIGNSSSATGGPGYGGGMFADGGMARNNTISNNTATGGSDSLGGGVYGDVATLEQNIVTSNSANRGGAIYAYGGTTARNTILTNTTTLTGTLYVDAGIATQNAVRGNTANYGGGLYGFNASLTGNIVQNNTANLAGGGIYATNNSTLNGNVVQSNSAQSEGGGIYANGGSVTYNKVKYNIVPSFGRGSGAYLVGTVDFSYNSVTTNTASGGTAGGVSINGQPQVHFNNLYSNQPYDAEIVSSGSVSGTLNYWGASPCTAIPAQIYDGNDLPGRGQLLYAPSLYSPLPLAQLPAPTSLSIVTSTTGITLTWAGISALPDVGCTSTGSTGPDASYRVYYDTDDGCAPYDGQGLPLGNSPIDVGLATTVVLSGLAEGNYYFVVTAHDYLRRESAYSNQVMWPPLPWRIYLPAILKAS